MRDAVLWLAALLVACTPAGAAAPASVSTGSVTRGTFTQRLVLTGEIDAADSVHLSGPRTEDWNLAIRWLAEDGAQVKAGDRVVGFDTSQVVDRARELELSLVEAGNAIVEQEAKSDVAVEDKAFEVDKQRITLDKAALDTTVPEHLLSRREAHNFALAKSRAEVALATATNDAQATKAAATLEAQVKRIAYDKAERSYNAAIEQLDGLDLVAPKSGIFLVGEHPWEGRKLQVGDNVWPGLTVARLPDLSRMVVRARLDDVDDGRVVPGQRATCIVDAWPDAPLQGHIVSVSGVAYEVAQQSTRRYFVVLVEIDDAPPGTLRPGLSVRVEVDTRTTDDALLVPRAAISWDGTTARAHLASGGTAELTLESCNAQVCAVTSGVDEGTALASAMEAE
jgi:HlyD family secretion protein